MVYWKISTWKTQQWAKDWKRLIFIPIPQKGNAKECSNYRTIALISHASKVMLKIFQPSINSTGNENFQMYKLDLEKAEKTQIKLLSYTGSQKKQKNSRKTSTSASLTTLKPLTAWITRKLLKILKEMGIPDHLTCLLTSPCVGQEATVRTGHWITDWFKSGKGVCQRCILSTCLFNVPGGLDGKAPASNAGSQVSIFGLGRSPGEGNGSTPVLLPGKSHRWRSLVGYSPWGCK